MLVLTNWFSRESVRQLVAVPPALLSLLVPGDRIVVYLMGWNIYAVVYLGVTWLVYRRRDPVTLRRNALLSRRRPLADRLLATHPEQLSQVAASIALSATVTAMPRAEDLGLPSPLAFGNCVAAVLTA